MGGVPTITIALTTISSDLDARARASSTPHSAIANGEPRYGPLCRSVRCGQAVVAVSVRRLRVSATARRARIASTQAATPRDVSAAPRGARATMAAAAARRLRLHPGRGGITAFGHLANRGGLPAGTRHDDGTERLPVCVVPVGVKQKMKTAGPAVEVVEAQRPDRARRAQRNPPQGRERQIELSRRRPRRVPVAETNQPVAVHHGVVRRRVLMTHDQARSQRAADEPPFVRRRHEADRRAMEPS
jgi:hypothetical protein